MIYFIGGIGLYILGWYLFWLLRLKKQPGRILAFHSISDKPDLSITRNSVNGFEKIIRYLKETGYSGTSLSGQVGEKDIALTFDDGWQSIYDNAFPILQKYGFSATVFVVTDYIGKASDWDYKKMQHLNWQQLRELADYGIEIGSHGAGHIDLRSLSDEKLEYEIAGSKKMLEDKLGIPVKYFSYPFGRYDKRIINKVMKAGYEKACALSSGGGEFAVARQGVYLYDTPYSVYLKIERQSWLEQCKDYVNNMLAGGTITYRKLFPVKSRG